VPLQQGRGSAPTWRLRTSPGGLADRRRSGLAELSLPEAASVSRAELAGCGKRQRRSRTKVPGVGNPIGVRGSRSRTCHPIGQIAKRCASACLSTGRRGRTRCGRSCSGGARGGLRLGLRLLLIGAGRGYLCPLGHGNGQEPALAALAAGHHTQQTASPRRESCLGRHESLGAGGSCRGR
jgi:hypothetical protein